MHRIFSLDGYLLTATNGDDHIQEADKLVHSIEPSIIIGSHDNKGIRIIPFSMYDGEDHLRESFERLL